MTTTTLEITIPADEPVIAVRRFVKAPPDLVFDAWTKPEHLSRWWGPRRLELVVCEVDLRVGGGYRMVHRAPDGQEFGFHGEYREIDPPHRLVSTFVYEGAPDHMAVETLTLEAMDGGTLLHTSTVHDSTEARDMHVASGMEEGMTESHERLDELLASLQSA
jgi:uncharacterized protein YndB with AHSA1/START domain